MQEKLGDKNKPYQLRVMIALSCHGVDFVAPLTPKYVTADALILSYRGYNYNDGPQNYRIGRAIDKWLKNPKYTFDSYGKAIADGFGIVGVPALHGVTSVASKIGNLFGF